MRTAKLRRALVLSFLSLLCIPQIVQAGCTYAHRFAGEQQEIGVQLYWTTASESNNARFIIERAIDGGDFESIGMIAGAGDSEEETRYEFLDFDAYGQYILYRLKQEDHSGEAVYSKTIFLTREMTHNFMIAEMTGIHATEVFEVTIDALVDCPLKYTLTDAEGEVVLSEELHLPRGLHEIGIALGDRKEGIYRLAIESGTVSEDLTFRKIYDETKPRTTTAQH